MGGDQVFSSLLGIFKSDQIFHFFILVRSPSSCLFIPSLATPPVLQESPLSSPSKLGLGPPPVPPPQHPSSAAAQAAAAATPSPQKAPPPVPIKTKPSTSSASQALPTPLQPDHPPVSTTASAMASGGPKLFKPTPKHSSSGAAAAGTSHVDSRRVSGSGSASVNPFRDGAAEASLPPTPAPPASNSYVLAHAHAPLPTPAPTLSYATPIDVLLGFDPAPNPFKQSKPRIVRPTPVVATANSPVPNPFRNTGSSNKNGGPESTRSVGSHVSAEAGGGGPFASPPLPPRPLALEKLPPPLPPRLPVSPLIQASLNARSEVQRAKKALPPKTFSVIQSNTGKPQEKAAPRLLTGQAADETVLAQLEGVAAGAGGNELAGIGAQSHTSGGQVSQGLPKPESTRRRHGHSNSRGTNQYDPRRSVSDIPSNLLRRESGDSDVVPPPPQRSPTSKRSNGFPQTVAPKASYNYPEGARGNPVTARAVSHMSTQSLGRMGAGNIKSGLPSWLEEQEELQRSALVDGPEDDNGELDSLVDNTDAQTLSSQAQSAASIERNNPFFPPHKRDVERGFGAGPPESAIPGYIKDRPLGRSKTLHGKPPPPNLPSRRRLDSSPAYGATSGHAFSSQAPGLSPMPPTPGGGNGGAPPTASATGFASALAGNSGGKYTGIRPDRDGSSNSGLRLIPPQQKAITDLVAHAEKDEPQFRPATTRPVTKRTNSYSSSTSGAGPISPVEDSLWSTITRTGTAPGWAGKRHSINGTDHFGSIRDRFAETFKIGESESNPVKPKGQRPIDLIGQDAVSIAERHRWLASAAERARGVKPLNEARMGLMQDSEAFDDDGTSPVQDEFSPTKSYDAPAPDSDFQQNSNSNSHSTSTRNPPPPIPSRNSTSPVLQRRASLPAGKKNHPPVPPARRQLSSGARAGLPSFDSDAEIEEEDEEDENEKNRRRNAGWSQLS